MGPRQATTAGPAKPSGYGMWLPAEPCAADARSVRRKEVGGWTLHVRRAPRRFRAILGMTSAPPGLDCLPLTDLAHRARWPDGILHRHFLRLTWIGVPRENMGRYPTFSHIRGDPGQPNGTGPAPALGCEHHIPGGYPAGFDWVKKFVCSSSRRRPGPFEGPEIALRFPRKGLFSLGKQAESEYVLLAPGFRRDDKWKGFETCSNRCARRKLCNENLRPAEHPQAASWTSRQTSP